MPQAVGDSYGGIQLAFGRDCILPKPIDARLLKVLSAALARAAIYGGVATRPYPAHYPLRSVDRVFPA